jgi:hypothetical protein
LKRLSEKVIVFKNMKFEKDELDSKEDDTTEDTEL